MHAIFFSEVTTNTTARALYDQYSPIDISVWCWQLFACSPSCFSEVTMLMFSCTSPTSLLVTHSAAVPLWSLTVRVTVLLTVWSDADVMTTNSVYFFNSGHLMEGKGSPSAIHMQVKTLDWTSHPEFCRIFGNPVSTQAEPWHHNKMLIE